MRNIYIKFIYFIIITLTSFTLSASAFVLNKAKTSSPSDKHQILSTGPDFATYKISYLTPSLLNRSLQKIYSQSNLQILWSEDGICYLKAECIKDLLAEDNILVGKIFWLNEIVDGKLASQDWSYHVANYLYSDKNQIIIIDPFFSNDLLSVEEWKQKIKLKLKLKATHTKSISLRSPNLIAFDFESNAFVSKHELKESWKQHIRKREIKTNTSTYPGVIGF